MTPDQQKALALRMARAMHRTFFSPSRPYEKRLITMAGYMLSAMLSDDLGKEIAERNAEQLNIFDDQLQLL